MVTVADLDNFDQVFAFHDLSGWITWVYDNNTSRDEAVFFCLYDLLLEIFWI